jgi:hypothetical protein
MRQVQSAFATPPRYTTPIVRAVVVAVYFADGQEERAASMQQRDPKFYGVKTVAVDVLTFGGRFRAYLQKVPVAPRRHGLNDYDGLWIPRAASVDLSTGGPPILGQTPGQTPSDPRDLDGDHVLVEFLDNDPTQPFIRDQLPHPRASYTQLKAAGDARESKFRGVVTRIDKDGNVVVDTTGANSGAIHQTTGEETAALDNAHGKLTIKLNHNAPFQLVGVDTAGGAEKYSLAIDPAAKTFTLRLDNGSALTVTDKDGNAVLQLGDGAVKATREDLLNTLWGQLKTYLDAHTHPEIALRAALGVAGADPTLLSLAPLAAAALAAASGSLPTPPAAPSPSWDSSVGSNKLTFPAG